MNKTFLKNISLDLASSIDDNNEKKVVTTWNLDNIYKYYKSKIDCLDYNIVIEFLDQKDFIVKDKKTLEFLFVWLRSHILKSDKGGYAPLVKEMLTNQRKV